MASVGQELLNVPLPEMVTKLSLGIAEAQTKLDMNSAEVAKFMSTQTISLPDIANPTNSKDFALISLGFFPGFYQFTEATIDVKMAITMATSTEAQIGVTAKAGFGCFSASVNASYSSKYSYSVDGSSALHVRLAPVPPPQILQDYMEALIKKMSTP